MHKYVCTHTALMHSGSIEEGKTHFFWHSCRPHRSYAAVMDYRRKSVVWLLHIPPIPLTMLV